MNSIPGFASAQRQWENMEPAWADECICESRFECEDCGADNFTEADLGKNCPDVECEGVVVEVEHGLAVSGCREHGWCTGCSSRHCEDCNG